MRRRLSILFLLCAATARAGFDGDPFYEHSTTTNGESFLAVRPFYSDYTDPHRRRWREDVLWPLYTRKGFEDETYSRFLFFGYSADFSPDSDRHRNWIIPFWFSGVDQQGEGYAALFPLGGTIREFLGFDKVSFVLFPIYAQAGIDSNRTTSVLWPIYSRTTGPRVDRFRVWPFYGYSDLAGEYEKKFVLWPFYTSVRYFNDRNPGGGFILVPVYGHIKTEKADNYWYVAPFIRYATSEKQWIVHAPWPFIQLADGDLYKRIFWPIYGKKHLGTLTQQFFLWPFIWNNTTAYPRHDLHRVLGVPFFSYESETATKPSTGHEVGDVFSRYWKIWPLASWDRRGDVSRFRTLEFWPLRDTPGVERNWAPFWTLYRRTANDGHIDHDLLWGLYRQSGGPNEFEWSLLKGFAGYKKSGSNRRYRFCFLWFGGDEEKP